MRTVFAFVQFFDNEECLGSKFGFPMLEFHAGFNSVGLGRGRGTTNILGFQPITYDFNYLRELWLRIWNLGQTSGVPDQNWLFLASCTVRPDIPVSTSLTNISDTFHLPRNCHKYHILPKKSYTAALPYWIEESDTDQNHCKQSAYVSAVNVNTRTALFMSIEQPHTFAMWEYIVSHPGFADAGVLPTGYY